MSKNIKFHVVQNFVLTKRTKENVIMAKFSYQMSDSEAILAFKKGFAGVGVGNVAILKDSGNEFVLGSPMMTVKVVIKGGVCTTKGSLFGKLIESTINTKIELLDGFVKM